MERTVYRERLKLLKKIGRLRVGLQALGLRPLEVGRGQLEAGVGDRGRQGGHPPLWVLTVCHRGDGS